MRRLALALTALGLLLHAPHAEAQRAASLTAPPTASWLPSLPVAIRTGVIEAPDSTGSGWTRLHLVKEKGPTHIVVLFRLRDGSSPAAFLAALETARQTPSTGLALGGLEVVSDGEVVMNLAPGRYVLACMGRGADGKRHFATGESKVFVVAPQRATNRAAVKAPPASAELHMLDFAYRTPERWRSGAQWVRVSNEGKEDHLVLIARLRDGATLREWTTAKLPETVATPVTGVSRTSTGGVVYLPLALSPGRYVLYCRIPHAATGTLHEKLGMFKEITVE